MQELEELCLDAYDNAMIYKQKTRAWHDKHILWKELNVGDKVLLYQSRLKLFPGKLRSRWEGPYTISRIFSHGAIELYDPKSNELFKVNGHRVKPYFENIPHNEEEELVLAEPTD